MFPKFYQLKPEKQEKIINAALKEFSKKSYKQASTDEIVNEAGISKGALFHYFHNKKDLYLFLLDYCIKIFNEEYFGAIDLSERDFLLRLRQMILIKLSVLSRHPDITNFTTKAFFEEDDEIKEFTKQIINEVRSKNYSILQDNIDTSNIREDVNAQMLNNIILWTFEGYANNVQNNFKDQPMDQELFDRWISELNDYIELFRKYFYKGGQES